MIALPGDRLQKATANSECRRVRSAVMHASMIISAPDLVAYRRNILCAGEWVGVGRDR